MSEIAEMLTRDEQAILRGWFEDVGDCLTDDERAKRCKLRGWSMGKRRVVEGILGRLRDGGVYVSGLDSLGGWVCLNPLWSGLLGRHQGGLETRTLG